MEKHVVERLTLENLVPTTSLESLAHGYILNCQCEVKSPQTLAIYGTVLKNFQWYCHGNQYPDEPHKLNPMHVRQFLWYVASSTNRWGSNNPAARAQASRTTVHDYYRALRTFFNWLEREGLIHENPFTRLKPPKA
jgi:integrase/recombinase XerC